MIKKTRPSHYIKATIAASCLSLLLITSTTALADDSSDELSPTPGPMQQKTQTLQQSLISKDATTTASKEIAYDLDIMMFYPMTQLAHILRYTLDTRPPELNKTLQNELIETTSSQAMADDTLQSLFFYDQQTLENAATKSVLSSTSPSLKAPFFYSTHNFGYLIHQSMKSNQTALATDVIDDFGTIDTSTSPSGVNLRVLGSSPSSPLVICPVSNVTASESLLGPSYVPPECYSITAQTLMGTTEYTYNNTAQQNAAEQYLSLASGSYVGLKPPTTNWYNADNLKNEDVAHYISYYQTSQALKSLGAYVLAHAYSIRMPSKDGKTRSAMAQYNELQAKMASNSEFWSRMNKTPVIGQLTIIADYMPIIAFGIARQNQQLEMISDSLGAMLVAQSLLLQQSGSVLYGKAYQAVNGSTGEQTIPAG
ncbi:MAG: hypothetical protein GY782_11220 [Gammaproteobacteria bacterium]|nr:hypothetical protein [Gammaproteobacteria bacterium]